MSIYFFLLLLLFPSPPPLFSLFPLNTPSHSSSSSSNTTTAVDGSNGDLHLRGTTVEQWSRSRDPHMDTVTTTVIDFNIPVQTAFEKVVDDYV